MHKQFVANHSPEFNRWINSSFMLWINLALDDLWVFQTRLSVPTGYFPQILCPAGAGPTPATGNSQLSSERPRLTPPARGTWTCGRPALPFPALRCHSEGTRQAVPQSLPDDISQPNPLSFASAVPVGEKKLSQSLNSCFNSNKLLCIRGLVSQHQGMQGSSTDIAYTS